MFHQCTRKHATLLLPTGLPIYINIIGIFVIFLSLSLVSRVSRIVSIFYSLTLNDLLSCTRYGKRCSMIVSHDRASIECVDRGRMSGKGGMKMKGGEGMLFARHERELREGYGESTLFAPPRMGRIDPRRGLRGDTDPTLSGCYPPEMVASTPFSFFSP